LKYVAKVACIPTWPSLARAELGCSRLCSPFQEDPLTLFSSCMLFVPNRMVFH
jgi:hypothetical protein